MPKPKRRTADPIDPIAENPDNDPLPAQELPAPSKQPPVEISQDAPAVADTSPTPTKSWSTGPNPFPTVTVRWGEYAIRLQENHDRNEIQIRFGDGSSADKPMNFAQIEPMLRSGGLKWNPRDKAWGFALEWQERLIDAESAAHNAQIRRRNAVSRAKVEDLFEEIIRVETEARGPVSGISGKSELAR